MRIYVLPLLLVAGSVSSLDVSAQEFATTEAKKAQHKFLQALKAAEASYIADLESAAKEAVKSKNTDEVARIKERIGDLKSQQQLDRGDPVVQLRRRLVDTTWTMNRPSSPETIRFLPNNRIFRSTKGGSMGVWESLESRVVIVKFDDNLFLFQFDEKVEAYNVVAFGPVPTLYKTGARVQ